METILNFKEFFQNAILEKKNKHDNLSGVVVIYKNKILLVKAKKFIGKKQKWSIPKGRIEKNDNNIITAFKELEEETGIKLKNINIISKGKLIYKKGVKKILNYFVIKLSDKDINVEINQDGSIPKYYYKNSEIKKAKFFDKKDAIGKLEFGQLNVLKYL